jgi:hypothetical protein
MFGRNNVSRTVLSLAVLSALTTACGGGMGGSDPGDNVPHPLVRQFSPFMSPIDFGTGQANPTFTDGLLTINTEPAYPGKICVFFQEGTEIDPNSVFIGGNPTLGIDLSSLQILRFIPGTGNVPLQPAANGVEVLADRIIFTPASLPLPDGQYSIGVFANLKSTEGDPVDQTPVFHSFTVGDADTIAPIVVVTSPIDAATGVGAGVAPPQPPPGAAGVADVRTAIFGPVSPDIIIRFSESIAADSVNTSTVLVVDAGAFVPGGGAPPAVPPAPSFPKLKSALDTSSLPSNGFEVVWRADPQTGGLPFGTQVQVTMIGSDGGANGAPITDRSGNMLQNSFQFQFQTIAPPNLPANPEPEYAIYWTASDRFGVLDTINQKEIAATFLGTQTTQIVRNFLPDFTDKIATKKTLGLTFDPNEISVDARTDGASCHSYCYVQSFQSGQVVIINTRTSLPVALINTPSPGGLSNQTGGGQAANVLVVTNSSANTFTVFDISNLTTGRPFLSGPIYVTQVNPTGNTPRSITISAPATGAFNREFFSGGPGVPLILYTDYADGVVSTANLASTEPIRQFALGVGAAPNDIVMTPCIPAIPPLLIAAISEGGLPGEGKVAYYVAGPTCGSGFGAGARPDSIVGDLSGFDAPAGLDNIFPFSTTAFFALAESGSTKNQVVTLGITPGAFTFPNIVREFPTGANPVAVAHPTSWFSPLLGGSICQLGTPGCPIRGVIYTPPPCWYFGTEQFPAQPDGSGDPSATLYVCVRGAGRIEVLDSVTGSRDFFSPIFIPGVRMVGSPGSQ